MADTEKLKHQKVCIWSPEGMQLFNYGVRIILLDGGEEKEAKPIQGSTEVKIAESQPGIVSGCSSCKVLYETREEQVAHCKEKWHLFNCYQKAHGRRVITKEQYSQITHPEKFVTKNTSSEDGRSYERITDTFKQLSLEMEGHVEDKEDPASYDRPRALARQAKLYFISNEGKVFSLYQTVVKPKKKSDDDAKMLLQFARSVHKRERWAYIILGGGCFAGAVFKKTDVVMHKTLKCYAKRGKQGKFQTTNDNKYNRASRSAGASVRRENIAHFKKNLREVICNWAKALEECELLFYRTPGISKEFLFGGKEPLLNKHDPRLRTIPLSITKPIFKEVVRIHQALSTIELYGLQESVMGQDGLPDPVIVSPRKSARQDGEANDTNNSPRRGSCIDRAKERPLTVRPVPDEVRILAENCQSPTDLIDEDAAFRHIPFSVLGLSVLSIPCSTDDDADVPLQNDYSCVEVSKGSVEGNSCQVETKPIKRNKGRKTNKIKSSPASEEITPGVLGRLLPGTKRQLLNSLHTKCCKEGFSELKSACCLYQRGGNETAVPDHSLCLKSQVDLSLFVKLGSTVNVSVKQLLNVNLGNGRTCLHAAAAADNTAAIRFLLEHGSDPASLDDFGNSPYLSTVNKEVRNEFRRFMADYPDKYDYQKAGVPAPLTKEMEDSRAEKERNMKKAKKQKQKILKNLKIEAKKEEEEKIKFLQLSDEEKLRISKTKMKEEPAQPTQRCFQCASTITKIPFEYMNYKFCTTACVQGHRKAAKQSKT